MRISSLLALSLLLSLPAVAQVAPPAEGPRLTVTTNDKGVTIRVGDKESYLIDPPALGENGDVKPIEATTVGGEGRFRYASGAKATLSAGEGAFTVTLSGVPAEQRRVRMSALLPFGLALGGQWATDAPPRPFPETIPAEPHLYQGSAARFQITDTQGQGFALTLPPSSYQQLTDNRKWNWKIFAWFFMTPLSAADSTLTVRVEGAGVAAPRRTALSDRFGQSTRSDWPGKLKDEAELKADIADEATYLASLKSPERDVYGGLPGSREKLGLKKTGFFHVEKKGDRWILVNPEGNAFFHLGICASIGGAGDHTKLQGNDGQFEWLPGNDPQFKPAFRQYGGDFSFYQANLIRKYGAFDENAHTRRLVERYRKWGFNSGGAFTDPTPATMEAKFPYVASLPLGQWSGNMRSLLLPGVRGVFDPFHPDVAAEIERNVAASVPKRADDPLLIGYFLENEQAFEDIPRAIPALTGGVPAKNELVRMLQAKYGTIEKLNAAWNLKAASFDELRNQGIPVATREASADMQAYIEHFLDAYYKIIADTYRRYDKNHMLIGNRWQPSTANSEALCRAAGKYMDVVSVNYYTYGVDPAFLKRLHDWSGGKPFILSEFHYSSPKDSGLPGGLGEVASQKERGLAYRNYVEQAASLGFVVGIEWFSAIDQPITGRYFDGENGNIGLLSVVDRPYRDMIALVKTTNDDIYRVWMGERPPFAFDDPRFKVAATGGRKVVQAPKVAKAPAMDGTAVGWPGNPPTPIGTDRLVMGSEAAGLEALFRLCHDGANLYLSIDVKDETPMKNDLSGDRLWSADGIEVFIGAEDIKEAGPLRFGDRQILIGAGAGKPLSYVGNSATQPELKALVVAAPDGKGYRLQATLPLAALGQRVAPGAELLFDLAVDDSEDGKQRLRQIMWNGIARNSSDRSQWGRLKLGE